MMNNQTERATIEQLRELAAVDLGSKCPATQARGRDLLRMIEVLKVKLIAKGDCSIRVTSREGSVWGRT